MVKVVWEKMRLSHHDDASRLLHGAHAHDGGHADGGALEVNAAVRDRGND